MYELTKKQLTLVNNIFMQYCEDCDSSEDTKRIVDDIWAKIMLMNEDAIDDGTTPKFEPAEEEL